MAQARIVLWLQLGVALFAFFLGLELLGSSFKLLGRDVASALIETTANPVVGLFAGVLATALIQSSSTVTSLVVSIVAGGGLTVAGAIPIVMGANVGTSITNTFVSLGHITSRDEFRLATAGATVHDMFNLLTVAILLPLEMAFGILSVPALWLAAGLSDVGGPSLLSPVNAIVGPVAHSVLGLLESNGWLGLVAGA
ncbi:MAG: Na/Pi symporter, partial [Rhodothermales bacterium]|nr:Na/Pi symporter [Rhodothermales bacterium]